jgi:hypothetical protein
VRMSACGHIKRSGRRASKDREERTLIRRLADREGFIHKYQRE